MPDFTGKPHFHRIVQILTTLGFFNGACSLFVLFLYWRFDLLHGRRVTFMSRLVLFMTILQLIQDVSLGYEYQCQTYYQGNDDLFWTESTPNAVAASGKRCSRSQWLVEEFSGTMLQSVCLQMSACFFLIVYHQRSFEFNRPLLLVNIGSAVFAFVGACVNAFGSYDCTMRYSPKGIVKTLYKCPPAPPNLDYAAPNYYAPGKMAWRILELCRLAMACLSFAIIVASLYIFRFRVMSSRSNIRRGKTQAMSVLRNKIIYYPLCQILTRVPCLYLVIYGNLEDIDYWSAEASADKRGDRSAAYANDMGRVATGYLYGLLAPAGGFFMLLIFIYNNPSAHDWFMRAYRNTTCSFPRIAKHKARIDGENTHAAPLFGSSSKVSQLNVGDDNEASGVSGAGGVSPGSDDASTASHTNLDEDELMMVIAEDANSDSVAGVVRDSVQRSVQEMRLAGPGGVLMTSRGSLVRTRSSSFTISQRRASAPATTAAAASALDHVPPPMLSGHVQQQQTPTNNSPESPSIGVATILASEGGLADHGTACVNPLTLMSVGSDHIVMEDNPMATQNASSLSPSHSPSHSRPNVQSV